MIKPAAPFDPSKIGKPPNFINWGSNGKPGPSSHVEIAMLTQEATNKIPEVACTATWATLVRLRICAKCGAPDITDAAGLARHLRQRPQELGELLPAARGEVPDQPAAKRARSQKERRVTDERIHPIRHPRERDASKMSGAGAFLPPPGTRTQFPGAVARER